MSKKKNNTKQCCRYYYELIKDTSIKELLANNNWIFNDAWNFWAYCKHIDSIKLSEFSLDPIVEDKFILFSSLMHEFEDWEDIINWDHYGAWYAYNFPIPMQTIKEALLLGIDSDLPIEDGTNSPLTNYFSLGEEWQFIHSIQPDVFLVKKSNDLVIGSPDFHTVWTMKRNLI